MTKQITAENFTPMTDEMIDTLYYTDPSFQDMTLEEFREDVRGEEEAVKVLLGLGFEVVSKSQEEEVNE